MARLAQATARADDALAAIQRAETEFASQRQRLEEALNESVPSGQDVGDFLRIRQAVAKHDPLAPNAGPIAEAVEALTGNPVYAAHYETNPRYADIRTQTAMLFPTTASE